MRNESKRLTRKQFVTATAAGATAAISMSFSRLAQAEAAASVVTQTTEFQIDTDRKDEAVEILQAMCQAVKKNEPDVLVYVCHLSQKDPSKVVFFEVYKDDAAMQNHRTTPHMKEMRKAFLSRSIGGGVLQPPTVVERLDKVGGFMR